MTKTHIITIDGIEVALRCSGATPILYRSQFKGDLIAEFNHIYMKNGEGEDKGDYLPEGAIELLIKAAYIMARQGDPKEKRSFEEWADQFSLMGLTNDLGRIAEILIEDEQTTEEPKKNTEEPSAV